MVIMGTIQVIENTKKYGTSYEVVTITNGDETRTTMTVWVNVAFLVFLSLIIYLLTLPLVDLELILKRLQKESD